MGKPHSATAIALFAAFTALSTGCGEPRHPGQGRVVFDDGEPVRAGSVEFRSAEGREHYASKIDREGYFCLASRDGAPGVPPGEYEAVVVLIVMTDQLAAGQHDHGRNVPTRYADYLTSRLTAKIDAIDSGPIELVISKQ